MIRNVLAILGVMYLLDSLSGKKRDPENENQSGGGCGCLMMFILILLIASGC